MSVTTNGPAAQAGLRPGDMVIQVNGSRVNRVRDVISVLEHVEPGQVIQVTVLRGTLKVGLPLKLGEIPASQALSPAA
ncbi:MAG: PDZ domain-containing protein [Firmicutes bacterium]|nr:PDZ domain-containing protein [Bacillota bacterium]